MFLKIHVCYTIYTQFLLQYQTGNSWDKNEHVNTYRRLRRSMWWIRQLMVGIYCVLSRTAFHIFLNKNKIQIMYMKTLMKLSG